MPIRVYEIAKQRNLSTKEMIELLREGGFEVASHMSVLDQEAVDFIEKKLQEPVAGDKQAQQIVKPSEAPKNIPAQKEQRREFVHRPQQTEPFSGQKNDAKKVKTPGVVAAPAMLSDVALDLAKPVTELIVTLLKWGTVYNKNQILPEDVVVRLAKHYGAPLIEPEKQEEVAIKKAFGDGDHLVDRLPVVVVVGHVDHGKTTLLDFVRNTRVAAKEKGGITQHLGAYEATTPQGNVVFLDTPGHEAFSKIRARGVKVADVAILVVAADDGVMPQTIEAIKHIKAMGAPVIVAINKIDKADIARVEVVKRELSQHGLLPEEWGGDVICVPISAKTGKGVDQLLEMILLQAQIMELKADIQGAAKGYVLEAKMEKGRGPVATIICQQGILSVGDYFRAGKVVGKVSSLTNSQGKRLQEVKPSIPVLVAGFESLPDAGDFFEVIDREGYKKVRLAIESHKASAPKTTSSKDAINVIIKTDTNSSKEALIGSMEKLSKKLEKGYNVVLAGIGNISESDVMHASNTNSKIIALHVKPESSAALLAMRLGVEVKLYDIIYKLLEDLQQVSEATKEIKMIKTKIGEATVLKVFDIKNLGVIAGCYVKDGRFSKDGTVIIFRGNRKVGEGPIRSLQRDRKQVKEVHTNYECGFLVDGFDAWQQDDRVECYIEVPEGTKK